MDNRRRGRDCLIWSVAAMSNLVPVIGSDSIVMSRPAEYHWLMLPTRNVDRQKP
jgi:hypothetical protein